MTGPSYCCPSLVNETFAKTVEQSSGIPVVSIEYDGIGGSKNDRIVPFLKFPRFGPATGETAGTASV